MLSWLFRRNRSRSARSVVPNRIRLTVEALESRYCPSGPQITSFSASVVQGQTVLLTGTVDDPGASSVSVMFQGAASGTTPVSNGSFSLQTQATALGVISAQAFDNLNMYSSQFPTQLAAPAPTIMFTVAQDGEHNVAISGQVTDLSPGGLTVTFSGVVTGTATTSASGSFSYSGTASALGQINAAVTDLLGVTGSGTAQLTNSAPTINNLEAVYSAGTGVWTISGQVVDEYAAGLTVNLSNVPGEGTATATVETDNFFTLTVEAAATATNTVSASVTDWWGAVSQTVTVTM